MSVEPVQDRVMAVLVTLSVILVGVVTRPSPVGAVPVPLVPVAVADGEALAEDDGVELADADGEDEGDDEGEELADADGEEDADEDGEEDGDTEAEADALGLPLDVPPGPDSDTSSA